MKNSKIFNIIKKAGQAFVFNIGREQWLSDGVAAYSLAGLPVFSEDSLLCMMDKTTDDCFPVSMNTECDIDLNEDKAYEAAFLRVQIKWKKKDYVLVRYDITDGFFVNLKYISGFMDDYNYTFKVFKNQNMRYLVVFDGMFPVCIVMPASIIDTGFDENMSKIMQVINKSMKHAVPSVAGESVPERTLIGTWQNMSGEAEQVEI